MQSNDKTRDKILDVAAILFSERGYAGTAIDQVIKTCGIGKDTFYRRFASKLDLFEAMAVREREIVELRFQEVIKHSSGTTFEQLESSFRWLLEINLEPQLIAYKRIAFTEASVFGKSAQDAPSAITDYLVELMEKLIAQGNIQENDPNDLVMYIINSLILSPMMMAMLGSQQPLSSDWQKLYFDRTWERIFHGLKYIK
ncbi:TetR/AcrR family transcriptional regulator [Alteromonas sp. 5E99-2]|uniref:TetR/AcrR family transcriptional regulator n=1 Tax=Alteromonas sp. 5E99-2 TaxID=2817683 RepID=UPI001A98D1B2|nr:TetR/AcrR family transcriptional regulator [Alteromonas sp. 5E99-2]